MGMEEGQQVQARAEKAREQKRDQIWREQVLPKFTAAGLRAEQIDAARKMFCAGFDAGWENYQAFLMGEFIRENQKQKVHLA